jgi:tetratricopeptide (TPR) repeat protein
VNVYVRLDSPASPRADSRTVRGAVIDFEPAIGSFREGTALTDGGVLARFYNNLAVEHFAGSDEPRAYAYFKAAIVADPGFAASYANLAHLYRRRGFDREAEQLLRQAIATAGDPYVAVDALHRLLLDQGRGEEAARYAHVLQSLQERDPYYWLGVGLDRLQAAELRPAIIALERAAALSSGFGEVHKYLALAYHRAGDAERARNQLSLLASLQADDPGVSTLRKKIERARIE